MADFQIILQKCSFGDALWDSFKTWWLLKKTWLPGGGDVWRFNFCLMAVESYWPSLASCFCISFHLWQFQVRSYKNHDFKHLVVLYYDNQLYIDYILYMGERANLDVFIDSWSGKGLTLFNKQFLVHYLYWRRYSYFDQPIMWVNS